MGPIWSDSDDKWIAAFLYTMLALCALGAIALFAGLCWAVVFMTQHLHWVG